MGLSQRLYWRLQPWITPGLENSHVTYAKALEAATVPATSWLDLGCGHSFVPEWAPFSTKPRSGRRVVGVDMDAEALRQHQGISARVIANGERLPFRDGSFDLVTMNMVLEHVEEPGSLFEEVNRVVKPGGTFLVHTPNKKGYTTRLTRLVPARLRAGLASFLQDRATEDVYPTFYRANTFDQLRQLAAKTGFQSHSVTFVDSSPIFVNLAPLLLPEMVFIRGIRQFGLDRLKPCLIATFRKGGAG